MFEPVHGSAPKYTGKNRVNPTATILSGALMLRHLGEQAAAKRVEDGVAKVIADGRYVTYDLSPPGTTRPPSALRRWPTPSWTHYNRGELRTNPRRALAITSGTFEEMTRIASCSSNSSRIVPAPGNARFAIQRKLDRAIDKVNIMGHSSPACQRWTKKPVNRWEICSLISLYPSHRSTKRKKR
jgi:hypothetical protein